MLHELADVGVDYGDVVAMLERQGGKKFTESWDELASSVWRFIDEKLRLTAWERR